MKRLLKILTWGKSRSLVRWLKCMKYDFPPRRLCKYANRTNGATVCPSLNNSKAASLAPNCWLLGGRSQSVYSFCEKRKIFFYWEKNSLVAREKLWEEFLAFIHHNNIFWSSRFVCVFSWKAFFGHWKFLTWTWMPSSTYKFDSLIEEWKLWGNF